MKDSLLRARTAHLLPALALAWTLALLVPALASAACSGATTNNYTGPAGGDWATGANWTTPDGVSHAAPVPSDYVCVPAGKSVLVTAGANVGDIDVEGTLTVTGATLIVGPLIASRLAGTVVVDGGGVLKLLSNTDYSAGSLELNNGELRNVSGNTFRILGGLDVNTTGGGIVANDGTLNIAGSTGANNTLLNAALNNEGLVTNDGPVRVLGGGFGDGSWKLGSGAGADEPVVTIDTTAFAMNGNFTDVDSGGLGHLVVANTTLQMQSTLTVDPHINVYQLDLANNGSTLDFSPIPVGTASVSAAYLNLDANGLLEVDAPLNAGTLTQRDGSIIANGAWSVDFFHWGGGDISGGGSTVTARVLEMTVVAGDTGVRTLTGAKLATTGGGTYNAGTLDVPTTLTIANGARWNVNNDVDITGAGTIVNHGTIDKIGLGGTSQIDPLLDMPDGTLAVSLGTLTLTQLPVQYDGVNDTLIGGNWSLSGTLQMPGPMGSLSAGVQFNGANAHLEDTTAGNADALTTMRSNAAGNVLALSGTAHLDPPAGSDFTNSGTVELSGTAAVNVSANQDYIQATSAAVTNLKGAGAALNVSGAGVVDVTRGTLSGLGTVNGNVANSGGTLAPGNSPGTLTIAGNYTQTGTGIMIEEIDGPAAGQFDQLVVTGTATLGGTLIIGSTNGYEAPVGQGFDAVVAGALAAPFGGIVEPPVGPYYDVAYGATTVRLTANALSVGDANVTEGNSGTTDATFTVVLGQAAPAAVTVDWATQDGTATAGSDYTAASGALSFAPGETTKTVTVSVNGDTVVEPGENFAVNLSNPTGSRIARANGVGTIADDESGPVAVPSAVPPGDIDGFLTPPPPVQGKKVNVEPVSGKVKVRLPGAKSFVPLPDGEQVPVGTIVDATKGVVRLFSVGTGRRVQSAIFYEGVFQVLQKVGQAITEAKLVGGNFTSACPASSRARASAKRSGSKSVRHLWASGSGKFRTAGRYASATIRGTKWLTDDRCNGTLVRVTVGAVTVRDLTLKKSIALKKPKSYLAPAVRPRKK